MKSPLKDKPLPSPGDSTQQAIDNFLLEKVDPYILAAALLSMLAMMDWYRYLTETPVRPWLFTVVAATAVALAGFKMFKGRARIRNMKLGRDGERAVGQYLELLRESGARIFHDIPGDGFNVDHVVISAAGIFVIETKTYSKPDKGEPTVTFDGEQVTMRGRGRFAEPVIQVTAGARWLRELLKTSTGKIFPVRPVLVFPGWFVQPTVEARNSDVWVLNPKALPAFINNSAQMLSVEDLALASYHLSRYLRTS